MFQSTLKEYATRFPETQIKTILTDVEEGIIKVLLYFDIFKYPLKENEILHFLPIRYHASLTKELSILCEKRLVHKNDDFYFTGQDDNRIVERRIKGNKMAEKYLATASRHSKWLSAIPFIQCVCISGSLSKNYMDDKSDIDYFIITKSNRLWIVRGIFTLIIKSMWVFNSKKYFCPNYIITESNLEIADKNIYTAIEIATLIPLFNDKTHHDFWVANEWVKDYLPNFPVNEKIHPDKKRRFHRLWQHSFFTKTDHFIFKLFKFHYEKKFYNSGKWNLTPHEFNFNKNFVKIHTMGHRNKILDKYDENMIDYKKTHGIDLG